MKAITFPQMIKTALLSIMLFQIYGCAVVGKNTLTPQSTLPTNEESSPLPTFPVDQTPVSYTITNLANIAPGCFVEAVSPNSEWIVKSCEPYRDLVVEKLDGSEAHTLISEHEKAVYLADFSPDGKRMTVTVMGDSIWLFDTGNWDEKQKLYSGQDVHANITWSPDSHTMAVTYLNEGKALSLLNVDGSSYDLISFAEIHRTQFDGMFNRFGPAWSPDSQKIAYLVLDGFTDEYPVSLWVIDLNDKSRKLLYSGKEGEFGLDPIWLSDGKTILLDTLYFGDSTNFLIVLDLSKGTFRKVWTYENSSLFAVSPDDKYVIACTLSEEFILIDLESSQIQSIGYQNAGDQGVTDQCSAPLFWVNQNTFLTRTGRNLLQIRFQGNP